MNEFRAFAKRVPRMIELYQLLILVPRFIKWVHWLCQIPKKLVVTNASLVNYIHSFRFGRIRNVAVVPILPSLPL
jgi:hypothetical protein